MAFTQLEVRTRSPSRAVKPIRGDSSSGRTLGEGGGSTRTILFFPPPFLFFFFRWGERCPAGDLSAGRRRRNSSFPLLWTVGARKDCPPSPPLPFPTFYRGKKSRRGERLGVDLRAGKDMYQDRVEAPDPARRVGEKGEKVFISPHTLVSRPPSICRVRHCICRERGGAYIKEGTEQRIVCTSCILTCLAYIHEKQKGFFNGSLLRQRDMANWATLCSLPIPTSFHFLEGDTTAPRKLATIERRRHIPDGLDRVGTHSKAR